MRSMFPDYEHKEELWKKHAKYVVILFKIFFSHSFKFFNNRKVEELTIPMALHYFEAIKGDLANIFKGNVEPLRVEVSKVIIFCMDSAIHNMLNCFSALP